MIESSPLPFNAAAAHNQQHATFVQSCSVVEFIHPCKQKGHRTRRRVAHRASGDLAGVHQITRSGEGKFRWVWIPNTLRPYPITEQGMYMGFGKGAYGYKSIGPTGLIPVRRHTGLPQSPNGTED